MVKNVISNLIVSFVSENLVEMVKLNEKKKRTKLFHKLSRCNYCKENLFDGLLNLFGNTLNFHCPLCKLLCNVQ